MIFCFAVYLFGKVFLAYGCVCLSIGGFGWVCGGCFCAKSGVFFAFFVFRCLFGICFGFGDRPVGAGWGSPRVGVVGGCPVGGCPGGGVREAIFAN